MLREAGAAEVHFRVSSPPYKWPCFYGLDTGRRSELLAADLSVGEIRDFIGVDSLAYLDLDRLIAATGASPGLVLHRVPVGRVPGPDPCSVAEPIEARARGCGRRPDVPRTSQLTPRATDVSERDERRGDGAANRSRTRAPASTSAPASSAVELIKEHVRSTLRPEVVGDIGGFGGLFAYRPRAHRATRCSCRRPTASARSR